MARHFRSKKAYHKWLAYGHMHGDFKRVPGYQNIFVRGKRIKVKHRR